MSNAQNFDDFDDDFDCQIIPKSRLSKLYDASCALQEAASFLLEAAETLRDSGEGTLSAKTMKLLHTLRPLSREVSDVATDRSLGIVG